MYIHCVFMALTCISFLFLRHELRDVCNIILCTLMWIFAIPTVAMYNFLVLIYRHTQLEALRFCTVMESECFNIQSVFGLGLCLWHQGLIIIPNLKNQILAILLYWSIKYISHTTQLPIFIGSHRFLPSGYCIRTKIYWQSGASALTYHTFMWCNLMSDA